ncbi:NAD(P)/FAD-dependent oxidoreductase [Enterobacterales bacterium AW_CKDN230030176-1A_HGKHYDSX7]
MGALWTGQRSAEKEGYALPDSLWAASASAAPATPPLAADTVADVLIIGAGFTGLCAAIQLAEAGWSCIVVDAAEPGWGASGRNNGQVIAGLKQDPEVIEQAFAGAVGRRLVAFGGDAPAKVWALVERYRIACSAKRSGWIQPACTRSGLAAVQRRHAAWRERGVEARLLDAADLQASLGTSKYTVGWYDPRGGSLQPLDYVRGLARVALGLGVRIHAQAHARALQRRDGRWQAGVGEHLVRAQRVIVATGAYADDLVPGLNKSFVPVRTAQIASEPLSEEQRAHILPGGQVCSDTRQLLTSFRLSPDGRLVMGGAGATAGPSHRAIVPYLQRAGTELFAHLGPLRWAYQWSGCFAVTTDHLPHVHEPQPGLHIAVGCNGRGIAVSTALGMCLAERVLGAPAHDLAVPVTSIHAVPLHPFHRLGVKLATTCKRWQDRMQ